MVVDCRGGATPKQKVRICLLLLTLPFPQLPILIISQPTSSPFPLVFLGQTGNLQGRLRLSDFGNSLVFQNSEG